MSPEAHDTEGPPPVDFDGDPLLARLVQDVNTRDTEEGLSITLIVGGVLVSGKLGSRTAYSRACMWHLDQGAERNSAAVRAAFDADVDPDASSSSAWSSYVHVQEVRFFDATGASVPRGRHWPSVWWRGRIDAVDGWTLGELRIDSGENV
ncbi:hypothetical protein BH23ACT10_BH23ACT10_08170 [soil metagenome]